MDGGPRTKDQGSPKFGNLPPFTAASAILHCRLGTDRGPRTKDQGSLPFGNLPPFTAAPTFYHGSKNDKTSSPLGFAMVIVPIAADASTLVHDRWSQMAAHTARSPPHGLVTHDADVADSRQMAPRTHLAPVSAHSATVAAGAAPLPPRQSGTYSRQRSPPGRTRAAAASSIAA